MLSQAPKIVLLHLHISTGIQVNHLMQLMAKTWAWQTVMVAGAMVLQIQHIEVGHIYRLVS